MALNREAKVMQRIEEICKGVAEKSIEMQWHGEARLRRAMALNGRAKQWLWMQGVALISNGKAWSRSESQRQSGVENGNALKRADLQWSSSEQISMDLQWHGIDMTGNGEKINERG